VGFPSGTGANVGHPPGVLHAAGDVAAEVHALLDAGVDGLFTDHPDRTLAACRDWSEGRRTATLVG
jgi:glycerophosphoryl diester phosphodiesterase